MILSDERIKKIVAEYIDPSDGYQAMDEEDLTDAIKQALDEQIKANVDESLQTEVEWLRGEVDRLSEMIDE